MSQRSAIVVVCDRVGAGYLGPYGNTWVDTPGLNRLAGESLLLENALADTSDLMTAYRSYWYGHHAMRSESAVDGQHHLATAADRQNAETRLITDDVEILQHPAADAFDRHWHVAPEENAGANLPVEETRLGRLFAAVLEQLSELRSPFLLWVHAQALAGPWDGPYALREQFAEEDDPPPPDFVVPPEPAVDTSLDPDTLWGIAQAYAGQIGVLELCLATLMDALSDHEAAEDTLFLFTSPRGFAMGADSYEGPCGTSLHSEVMQVPLLIRWPDQRAACRRRQALVQPADIWATIGDWLGLDLPSDVVLGRSLSPLVDPAFVWHRQIACARSATEHAVRTPAWFLRRKTDGSVRLHAKPDDWWDANEVSELCPERVEELETAFRQFEQFAQAPHLHEMPELPNTLLEPQR